MPLQKARERERERQREREKEREREREREREVTVITQIYNIKKLIIVKNGDVTNISHFAPTQLETNNEAGFLRLT